MKKIIIMLALINLVVESNLIAQEIKTDSVKKSFAEFSMGFKLYSIQFSRPTAHIRIFYNITPKIAIGYGWGLEGWTVLNGAYPPSLNAKDRSKKDSKKPEKGSKNGASPFKTLETVPKNGANPFTPE
jgi:hypothetical protein